MKNLIILIALFLSTLALAHAQEKTKEPLKIGIKSYWSPMLQTLGNEYSFDLGNFSHALTLEKENGNFYEFSLAPAFLSKRTFISTENSFLPEGGYDQRFLGSGLSAEYNYKLFKNKNNEKLSFYLGPKIDVGYNRISFTNQENSDKVVYNNLSASLSITPRVMYKINDKISIDLNCPITIVRANYRMNEPIGASSYNPSLNSRPNIAPRLGIQIKF